MAAGMTLVGLQRSWLADGLNATQITKCQKRDLHRGCVPEVHAGGSMWFLLLQPWTHSFLRSCRAHVRRALANYMRSRNARTAVGLAAIPSQRDAGTKHYIQHSVQGGQPSKPAKKHAVQSQWRQMLDTAVAR